MAGVYHLIRELLFGEPCALGVFFGGIDAQGPAEETGLLALHQDVAVGLAGDGGLGDALGVHAGEVRQTVRGQHVDGAVQVLVEFLRSGRDEGELALGGLLVEVQFHARCKGQARHHVDAPAHELGKKRLGQFESGQVALDEHGVAGLIGSEAGRVQAPEQDIGIFIELFCGQHGWEAPGVFVWETCMRFAQNTPACKAAMHEPRDTGP